MFLATAGVDVPVLPASLTNQIFLQLFHNPPLLRFCPKKTYCKCRAKPNFSDFSGGTPGFAKITASNDWDIYALWGKIFRRYSTRRPTSNTLNFTTSD
jgi:hypothetical protein